MTVLELIETLQGEIDDNPSFADLEVLMSGEESGDMVEVDGFLETSTSIWFSSSESDDD